MKKTAKRAMALLLSAAIAVGSPVGTWASEAEIFTDGNLFSSGEEPMMDAVEEVPSVEEEEPVISAQAPDFDFPRIERDPFSVYFDNLTEGYTKVPSETITIKNKYKETITVDVSHTGWIETGKLSKTTLKPGETAQIVVKPILGLTEKQYHSYLYFDLKAANGKWFRDQMDVGFRVKPQIILSAPSVKKVTLAENKCTVTLGEPVKGADGYQVAVETVNAAGMSEGKREAFVETTSLTARLNYLPKGRYHVICRSFVNTKNGRKYGIWNEDYKTIEVKDATPETPKLASASVRYCDLKLQVSTPQKIDGYDVVLSKRRKGTEPSDYVVYEKGFSGNSKEIVLYDIPKGTYYVTVHTYKNNRAGKKVYSPWSNFKKITIEKTKVTTPPVLKDVKVSGRNVILTVSRVKGTHCSNWALAKSCYRDPEDKNHIIPKHFAYMEKGTKETKIIFRNVKPGNYYVSGCGYLSAYKRHYTKWSPLKKITVK